MDKVKILPPIKPTHSGCLCCGSRVESHLAMDTVLYNGFGGWMISKDGELFYMAGNDVSDWDQFKTLSEIEKSAKRSAKSDWKAICDTPLHGDVYQRQRGKWVLVEQNPGFD